MEEQYYEKLLNVKTSGKQDLKETTIHYNRYEPTDYEALDRLCEECKIDKLDSVVDFGCGKGRLNFYLNYFCKCKVTGIEMNTYFYKQALDNKKSFLEKHKIDESKVNFVCTFAEKYDIKAEDNKFYFFNPFSMEIFMKVVNNILESVYDTKRDIEIILFYPADEYISFLDEYTLFTLHKEIKVDNVKNDRRYKFLIYKLAYI